MEYGTEALPLFDVGVGNFPTRNARFRAAVCQHFNLQWVSVGGTGNCFFEALSRVLEPQRTAAQLRADCVDLFRNSLDSTQPFFERIVVEIENELHQELVCSSRRSGMNGFKPGSVTEYIDAVSKDGVWVQGLHWCRAVSYLHDVRIGVVVYGSEYVRFVGSGTATVFLYNVDGRTHFDPLVPSTEAPMLPPGNHSGSDKESSVHASSHVVISSEDDDVAHPVRFVTRGECFSFFTYFFTLTHSSGSHCQNAVQSEQQRRRRPPSDRHSSCCSPW